MNVNTHTGTHTHIYYKFSMVSHSIRVIYSFIYNVYMYKNPTVERVCLIFRDNDDYLTSSNDPIKTTDPVGMQFIRKVNDDF